MLFRSCRISDHLGIQIDELLDTLGAYTKPVIFLGDGVAVFKEKIVAYLGERAKFAPSFQVMQRAGTLAELAVAAYAKGEVSDADAFVPMYLRKSQAERELEERQKGAH